MPPPVSGIRIIRTALAPHVKVEVCKPVWAVANPQLWQDWGLVKQEGKNDSYAKTSRRDSLTGTFSPVSVWGGAQR